MVIAEKEGMELLGSDVCLRSHNSPSDSQWGPCWVQGRCGRQQCSQTILRPTPNSCIQPQCTSQELGCQRQVLLQSNMMFCILSAM